MPNFDKMLGRGNQPQQKQITRVLDNLPFLLKDVCGLRLDGKPAKTGLKRKSKAWADLSPDSAWMLGWNFLRTPPKRGKYGKMLLEPRGCAKSTKMRALCTGLVITDRDTSIHYLSQNVEMAANRVTWVRQRLEANEGRFGEFRTRDKWGNEAFTVVRSGSSDEPTMLAGGPDKDVTGSHPDIFAWDDAVVPKTNSSRLLRRKLIRTFESTLDQRADAAYVLMIGTIYPYHNLSREIRDNYREDFEILRIGAWGAAYDENDNVVWGDPDSETLNYPWFTEEYLKKQRGNTPAKEQSFRGQYLNLWQFEGEDAPFEAVMLIDGDPPMTKDGKLHPRLAVYMLTDLAQTDKQTKNTSETCLAVIAKDIDGILYIVDIKIGRWNSDQVQEEFLNMYHTWEGQGLRYATMETRGPGRDAIYHIPKLAKARGERIPVIVPLPRSSREDKDARIGQLYVPFKHHQIRFSERLISKPAMFAIDSHGTPRGLAVERLLDYAPLSEGLDDVPDCLSDSYAVVKNAPICPDPTPPRASKPPDTDFEWSKKRALGKLHGKRIII